MVSTYRHKALRVPAIAKLCLRMYEDKPNLRLPRILREFLLYMCIVGFVVAKLKSQLSLEQCHCALMNHE